MSILLKCPNCGERSIYEFSFLGEARHIIPKTAAPEDVGFLYFRKNASGVQREWWFHVYGCKKWFIAVRDTATNTVLNTFWPEEENQMV